MKTFEESEKVAKQNAGQPIENKDFRKSPISRETAGFVLPDGPIAAAPGERVEGPRVEIGAATD
ncbi:MAG TPA: hypothetical protein VN637_11005 [Roseiarcus sp.]|nr:hypothetical protein [Roseiarcus sp.]